MNKRTRQKLVDAMVMSKENAEVDLGWRMSWKKLVDAVDMSREKAEIGLG